MIRASSSIASLAAAAALVLAATPGAQAAVTAKDAPSQADIVQVFPELADGTFSTDKVKNIGQPGKTCDAIVRVKVKSGSYTTGSSTTVVYPIVLVSAVEMKSEAKAKAYMATYKKYAKKCTTYTEPTTSSTVTVSKGKTFRFGDESLTVDTQSAFDTSTNYSSSVLTRDGKRLSTVIVVDDAAVPASSLKPLAKVAAKKLK